MLGLFSSVYGGNADGWSAWSGGLGQIVSCTARFSIVVYTEGSGLCCLLVWVWLGFVWCIGLGWSGLAHCTGLMWSNLVIELS